jgi:benzodiazapine receptor
MWRWMNTLAFFVNTVVTYGIGASKSSLVSSFGLKPNKDISEMYPTLVTPAGWAFAIWGIIFLLEGLSMISQLNYVDSYSALYTAHPYWVVTCILQCCWTLAFASNKIFLSNLLIIGLTASVFKTYIIYRMCGDPSRELYIFYTLPFGLHASWLGAASLVSLNITATAHGLSRQHLYKLATVTIMALPVLAVCCSLWLWDPVFLCVGGWAAYAMTVFKFPSSLSEKYTPAEISAQKARCRHVANFLCGGAMCFVAIVYLTI